MGPTRSGASSRPFEPRSTLRGLSRRAQVALTCRSNDLLVNNTTTLIVTELLDRADGAVPPQPTPIALALPADAVEDLAEAA